DRFLFSKEFSVEKQYADAISGNYSAKVEALDFWNARQTAEKIDKFVSDATMDRIKDIVTESTVEGADSLIINAIYFHGKWQRAFDKEYSKNGTFHSSTVKQKEIEYMSGNRVVQYYAEDEDMQVLSLPYFDTSYAFNILLPMKRFGLEELRRKLNGTSIKRVFSQLKLTKLEKISIPKMKIETDYKLKEALMAIGVTEMFSHSAELTGITRSAPLKVSRAAHKALIEIMAHLEFHSLEFTVDDGKQPQNFVEATREKRQKRHITCLIYAMN
ncbi:serine proteinase inhibitor, partial [Necator americanus]